VTWLYQVGFQQEFVSPAGHGGAAQALRTTVGFSVTLSNRHVLLPTTRFDPRRRPRAFAAVGGRAAWPPILWEVAKQMFPDL
jgi:hypothetical protein